ncbi:GntR family transcriptional regulator [Tissierellaceae bacterium HCP3S3_D8]|jgi:DNA-binding GntR family transcriptional regulator
MRGIRIKQPISQEVYEKLKSDILENILEPGERLVEMDIAKELNVSRTPVREALKQLEQDGLVTYFPRRGSIVSEISIEDALELYEVREYLEGLSVKLICLNINRKDIRALEEIVNLMDKGIEDRDYDSLYKLHSQWTETITKLTTNRYLRDQMIALFENLDRLRRISLYDMKQTVMACEETKSILQAIIDGDEEESERLARQHVKNARERFMTNIKRGKVKVKR